MSSTVRLGDGIRAVARSATRRVAGLRTHTATIDSLRVSYEEGHPSAQPTVLMVHGYSASSDVWTRFAAGLKNHHLVIPNLPGAAGSEFRPGAGYSAPAQADRLVAFLDHLGVEKVHVIGNSMGGFIAATLALRAPGRVISLALIDAAGVHSPDESPLARMLADGRNPFLLDHVGQFPEFYAMTMARPPYVPRVVLRAIAADYVLRRAQLSEIFNDFHDHDWLDEHLPHITAPTWIAWGRHDQLIDVSTARVWADGLPRSSLRIYDDLGHMPMLEAPRRVARDYVQFLSSLPEGAGPRLEDITYRADEAYLKTYLRRRRARRELSVQSD